MVRFTRLLAAVWLALSLALLPGRASAAEPEVTETPLTLAGTPEVDGRPVPIDVSLFTTDPGTARPAVVLAHGFGGTKADSAAVARRLAVAGYTVLTFTARGFGSSGGSIHLNHPAYEGADARRLIDLAMRRREVLREGSDPVIGFAGASYGGAISLLVAGLDRRVDAIAPAFTWNSLSRSLVPQHAAAGRARSLADVPAPAGRPTTGVFKQRWASLFFRSGQAAGPPTTGQDALCGRFSAELCRGYRQTAESGRPTPELLQSLRQSDLDPVLGRITAPVLLVAGEQDTLFGLDQADANLRGLPADTPAKVSWVEGGHDGEIDLDALVPELKSWFGRYLRQDGSAADTTFSAAVRETSLVGQPSDDPAPTLSLPGYPGRGAPVNDQRVRLQGDPQRVVAPPGGTPAALTNLPGTGGALASVSRLGGYPLGVLPGQAATFTSQPLAQPLTLLGSGRVDVTVTSTAPSGSTATLFAAVWDLGPDVVRSGTSGTSGTSGQAGPGTAVLPGLAVAPVRLTGLTPGQSRTVTVALPPVAHPVPVGHRLQLVLSSTDQAYAVPAAGSVHTVALAGDRTLVLPRIDSAALTAPPLEVPLPLLLVVGGLLLAAAAALLALWLRRRSSSVRADLSGTALAVHDLVKTYGDGYRAVDGVTFVAETGQVVGLLGPNGAGKTTTLRMLVGLIRPDAGAVYVHGTPVHAGSEVLGSVGAFIEGPGFLPHLSGVDNLHAYWRATGRPLEEACLDQVLEIAGLGGAVDRRVRSYSQGMRQRLGIAQAMLGLPTLLLLDEPTNGLDPPQIRAMRAVLADYAAAGRTVVVSSHLLSEVEQTCSHVVVMNRGRVVLTGSMAELTVAAEVTLIGLAEPADRVGACRSLAGLGVQAVVEEGDLIRVTGSLPRATLVAALVERGHAVDHVDGRRRLEEVFLHLVGSPAEEPADA